MLKATQRPTDVDSFTLPTHAAAWRDTPPQLERWMYQRANARKTVEVPTSSHVATISHPGIVADLVERAARATS